MKTVNIGLIGAGTVGGGVIDLINSNGALISARSGVELKLKYVCDTDASCLSGVPESKGMVKTDDAQKVLSDPDVDVIVELIGGTGAARDIMLKALARGKHVVTANKALLSECWKEIFGAAADSKRLVGFEASVGGGVPVIRAIRESFVSNNFEVVYGILNGTSNYILSMMADKGHSFDEALADAQAMGLAESDPTLDVSGMDTAHKLAVLSILGFGIEVSADDIYTEGITALTSQDIDNAAQWGYTIKLLAIAKRGADGLELRVHPTLLPERHILANVKGEDNAIFVKGDFIGESLFYGKGAGAKPTATSVVADIVEIAKLKDSGIVSMDPLYATDPVSILKMDDLSMSYYFRFSVIDKPGVLAGISTVLAENSISIASLSQEDRRAGKEVPVIMMAHKSIEGNMRKAIEEIDNSDFVTDKTVVIRVEE